MKTMTPLTPAPHPLPSAAPPHQAAASGLDAPMSPPDAAIAIPLRALPWAIPAFGAMLVLMTAVVWALVL